MDGDARMRRGTIVDRGWIRADSSDPLELILPHSNHSNANVIILRRVLSDPFHSTYFTIQLAAAANSSGFEDF